MSLESKLKTLRKKLDKCFSAETVTYFSEEIPSTGHCAVVSAIIHKRFGGIFRSTYVNGIKHWFNEIDGLQIDLTGDQFGFKKVQIKKDLYVDSIPRVWDDLNETTLKRVVIMEEKLKI
jgi:hypothetical protein